MLDNKLITFLTVVEQGTLAKASERLGLTQPAVSQHIKNLEEWYGLPLFDHVGRRLVLNDVGKLLVESAEQAQALFFQFMRKTENMQDGKKSYALGATLTIGEFILPEYLGKYRLANPGFELTINIENTANILRLLETGKIDLALVEGPFNKSRFENRIFLRDEMIFVGNRNYISDPEIPITPAELKQSRMILREKGSGTRYYWEEYCRRKGIELSLDSTIMEVGSLSAIKSLAVAGLGCSVMSKRAVIQEMTLGTLFSRSFSSGPLLRDLFFVYRKDSPLNFIHDFADFIKRNC